MLTEFAGRTAVVTGAASGIGLGLARRCGERGMNVAMLDVETDALRDAAALVGDADRVLPLTVDMSNAAQVDEAAAEVANRFDRVHLLCNNAGVSITGAMWTMTEHDCTWALGVNLFGVVNGLRAFVPGMLEHGEDAHVVSTASMAGLTPMANAGLYSATKAAVVAMSESMFYDLREMGSKIGVSVLCPGLVNTNIIRSERNRPEALPETGDTPAPESVSDYFKTGDSPLDVADRVLRAVEQDDFYILTGEAGRPDIAARGKVINELGRPVPPRPQAVLPDHATDKTRGIPSRR